MTSSKTLVWRPDSDTQDLASSPQKDSPRRDASDKRSRSGKRHNGGQRNCPHRPLPPELLAQIRAEGYGRSYVQKQIRKKTPMVFELYGEKVEGVIVRRLTYALDVLVKGRVRRIEKINIKYMCKREQEPRIASRIQIDPELKRQNLVSIVRSSERYQTEDSVLARCYKEKIPVTLTLRGGELITGIIDWFSQFEIKIDLVHGKSVVVFRHSLHHFSVA